MIISSRAGRELQIDMVDNLGYNKKKAVETA